MDFLSLYLMFKLTGRQCRKRNIIAAAVIGAALGTAEILFVPSSLGKITEVITSAATAFLMVLISHGRDKQALRSVLRESVILWGAGALLGGMMTAISELLPKSAYHGELGGGFGEIFILCAAVSCLIIRVASSVKAKKTLPVEFIYEGKTYAFTGLCDSGSFACDPITLTPVIIVSCDVLGELSDRLETGEEMNLRMIPIKTAAGEKLLRGFVPDNVKVAEREVKAIIASSGTEERFGGCACLIPSKLI